MPWQLGPPLSKNVSNIPLLRRIWTWIVPQICGSPSEMTTFPEQQHGIHQHFKEGLDTICLPDCCYSRLFPDLVTEQCLIKSIMTTYGLNRYASGSLKPNAFCGYWLCHTAYAKVNNSMLQLIDVKHSTSEKHKEATQDYQGVLKHTGATLSMSMESIQWRDFTATLCTAASRCVGKTPLFSERWPQRVRK